METSSPDGKRPAETVQSAGERFSEATGPGRKRAVRLGAAVAVLCIVLLLPGVVRRLNVLSLRTVSAVRGTLHDDRNLRLLVVRNEVVVETPASGRFVPLASEESRVRAGEALGLVVTEADQAVVRAPRPGIVRFHWDGWEHHLNGPSLWQRSPEEWRAFPVSGGRTPVDEAVSERTPVVRLVDSHAIRLYADMPQGVDLRPGQTVAMTMADVTSETLRAKVVETRRTTQSDTAVVLFELERYLPLLDAVRHVDGRIVLASYNGVIVPVDALVWDEAGAGLLVLRESRVNFVPVRLIAQVAERAAVDGVTPGTAVIVNPWRVTAW